MFRNEQPDVSTLLCATVILPIVLLTYGQHPIVLFRIPNTDQISISPSWMVNHEKSKAFNYLKTKLTGNGAVLMFELAFLFAYSKKEQKKAKAIICPPQSLDNKVSSAIKIFI